MLSDDTVFVGDDDGTSPTLQLVVDLSAGIGSVYLEMVEVEHQISVWRNAAVIVNKLVFTEVLRVVADKKSVKGHSLVGWII